MASGRRALSVVHVVLSLAVFTTAGAEPPRRAAADRATRPLLFHDVTQQAGLHFVHVNGATPEKYMPETMGSGVVVFDYNNDGWPDIFFVNSGSLVDRDLARGTRHALYHNNADGTFTDVTAQAGIAHRGYGMGACAADYDNDGWVDLYITGFGASVLYRNNADGRFTDVTGKAGVGVNLWSTGCAFADIDGDGRLDLFVARYVDFSVDNNKFCGELARGLRSYCHPNIYNGLSNVLFRNNGDGSFSDVTNAGGLASTVGKSLGVVFGDYDNDGRVDLYVANDSVPNFLYRNRGGGSFEEVAVFAGVAVATDGRPRAGMGTDLGDFDNDGFLDVVVTNLDRETHNLYRGSREGLFLDVTYPSGVGEATMPFVGWGVAFFDYDNDGFVDIVIANGNTLDNASLFRPDAAYAQRNVLLRNQGDGTFREIGEAAGRGLALVKVSRGLAVADFDNDGALDIVINNNGQTADLLRNGGTGNSALIVRTVGTKSSRDGIGARLTLRADGRVQTREVRAGSSYLSQHDGRVHFGLGAAGHAERLEVRWPSGVVDVVDNVAANHIVTVVEGRGIAKRTPFARRTTSAGAPATAALPPIDELP